MISICIPVWEQHGTGLTYLKTLCQSILNQTINDFEIVISDHSKNDEIQSYCSDLHKSHDGKYNILYVRYTQKYGNGVANLNNALRHATGDVIKIMFQDDIMFSDKCLEIVNQCFENENNTWMVCGCNHTTDGLNFYRQMIPMMNPQLLQGVNTISSPSVLAFRNKNIQYFDEELVMLMDVEYYHRLNLIYGAPCIVMDTLITNRQHENQISSKYDKNISDEIAYVLKKHNQI
jgi:glycosyltransferase involved in cell wall biosynthesis